MLQIVDIRANLLGAGGVLDDAVLDKYTFVRDAHLQRRRSLIYDGDPPPLPEQPNP
jgi:phospholipid-binding lipoprotein MlaA